jgi:hypothetical protein
LIELQNYGCVSLSFIKKMILYAILIATFDRDNCKGFYPFLDVIHWYMEYGKFVDCFSYYPCKCTPGYWHQSLVLINHVSVRGSIIQ